MNNPKIVVVISLMQRNSGILGGQEIRWGRIAKSLHSDTERKFIILCTRTMVESWKKYNIEPNKSNLIIFEDKYNKYLTWILAQFFALKNIPRKSIVQIPGPGWLIAPAVIFSKLLKQVKIITSLTSCKIKPLRKISFREYFVSLVLAKLSDVVDVLNPSIDLDGLVEFKKITVSPCSFSDPEKFFPIYPKKNKIVFAGHLQENKGAELLINILLNLPSNINFDIVICGISDTLEGYNKIVSDIASKNNKIQVIRTVDMPAMFADAKIFLSLQTWDNYPSQSLIEAMLSGCHSIATNVGDTNLLVKEPWGHIINVDECPIKIINIIERIINNIDSANIIIGNKARNFIIENHNIDKYISYLTGIWGFQNDKLNLNK